jgi:hypothetical protein
MNGQQPTAIDAALASLHPGKSSLDSIALAVVGHVALLDAGLETFWRGSPLRWWVTPAALVFVTVSAWLWKPGGRLLRRFGAAGAAVMSVGGLCVLLAATVWLPGGQTNGVRLALQSTSTILVVATALAVACAAIALMSRLGTVPDRARLAIRAGIGAAAVYSLVAFGLALADHTSYPALFHGGAAWARLPRWLQGTWIGAFGILPLAVLRELGLAASRLRARGGVRPAASTAAALAAAFVVALATVIGPTNAAGPAGSPAIAGSTGPAGAGGSVAQEDPTSAAPIAGSLSSVWESPTADKIERISRALQATAKAIPRDTFDPRSIVEKIGRDPDALVAWVRDNTSLVPYRGALRGPVGVLMDRVGSSLDRASLLAELLASAGHESRLAHATLSAMQAQDLLSRMSAPPPDRLNPPPPGGGDRFLPLAVQEGIPQDALLAGASARRAAYDAGIAEARRRVAEQGPLLTAAVTGLRKPVDAASANESISAAGDYWWVQTKDPSGWRDLDPGPIAARPEDLAGLRAETFERREAGGAFNLPPRHYHEIELRVVIEACQQGRVTRRVVLRHVLRPADLAGQSVTVFNIPRKWPKVPDFWSSFRPNHDMLRANLAAQTRWTPVLRVGRQLIQQSSFNADGRLEVPKSGGSDKVGAASGGMLSAFGGATGGGETETQGPSILTAEWIEFEIRVPGRRTDVARHEVFDLIGPSARASGVIPKSLTVDDRQRFETGLALLAPIDVLALSSRMSPDYVMYRSVELLIEPYQAWLALASERDSSRQTEKATALLKQDVQLSPLYSVALARTRVSPVAAQVYTDSPNLLVGRSRATVDGVGRVASRQLADFVRNDIAVVTTNEDPFATRVLQGLADTAAEYFAYRDSPGCENTTTVLARAAGLAQVVLSSAGDSRLASLGVSADTRARLRGDLQQGNVAVLPAVPIAVGGAQRIGWFSVRPADGRAIGVMDTGFHQGDTEKIEIDASVDLAETQGASAASSETAATMPSAGPAATAEGSGSSGGSLAYDANNWFQNWRAQWLAEALKKHLAARAAGM